MNGSSATAAWTMQTAGQEEHALGKKRLPFTGRMQVRQYIDDARECNHRNAESASSQVSLSYQLAGIHPGFAELPTSSAMATVASIAMYDNTPSQTLRLP